MKNVHLIVSLALSALLSSAMAGAAQNPQPSAGAAAPQPANATREELDQLRQAMEAQNRAQQQRLEELEKQNQELTLELRSAQTRLSLTEQQINRLSGAEAQAQSLRTAVAALQAVPPAAAAHTARPQKPERAIPTALSYRGVSIVPGGYFAAEALYRSHAENADINTSWAGIPWDAQAMAHLSEFRATSRATRLSLRAFGDAGGATLTGYFETDFLASGFGASETQTNGYSNRVRQMWGRVQFPGRWSFAAGQMWSLLTMNRSGIENLTEYSPALIDSTILPGFDYARQTGFRVTRSFPAWKTALAFSAENAATVGVTPANVPEDITAVLSGLSTTGTGIMSNTTYSTNVAPDLIAKAAFDPRLGHFEVKAVGRTFRDRLDATSTTAGKNNTLLGGAFGGSAYVPVFTPKVSYLAAAMYGAIGRYGATSTDVVVKPDGTLAAEKSIHGITGFEVHPTPRFDVYSYGSEEYLPRNYGYGLRSINNSKCFLETGFSCSASLKALETGSAGFWYRFYQGPGGTVQYGADYVYVLRDAWSGVGGAPRGVDNIVESSFRYYLP